MIKIEVPKTDEQRHAEDLKRKRETAKALRQDIASEQAAGWAVIFTVLAPWEAFLLMLVLGALHSVFVPVAAVGYGTSYMLVVGINLAAFMTGRFRRPLK